MEKAQIMKGVLEGCILKIIGQKETYGYEIVTELQYHGFSDAKEGTIYPLLLRLERKGLIKAYFKASPLGPKRKYYYLTPDGKHYTEEFFLIWEEIAATVESIYKKGGMNI